MRSFKDSKDRQWDINFNIGAAIRIKHKTGYDLLKMATDEDDQMPVLELLLSDITVAEVICAVVSDQLAEKNVTEDDFFGSLDGKCFADANSVFMEELKDFFLKSGKTAMVEIITQTQDQLNQSMNLDADQIAKAIQEQSGMQSGSQLELSG
mgnify:CR=1 FL=1